MKTLKLHSGISRLLPMIAVSMGLGMAAAVAAPQKTVIVPLGGKSFGIVLDSMGMQKSKNLFASSSPKTIILSTKYKYSVAGTIHGTGDLAGIVDPGTNLKDFLESIKVGSSSFLSGTVTTTNGTLIKKRTINGTKNLGFFSVGVSLTVQGKISPTGVISISVTNVVVTAPITVSGTIVLDGPTPTKPGARLSVTSL